MNTETVKFTTEVPIADADGKPIREGSVLREINDGERGVVVRIMRAGDRGTPFGAVGDMHVYKRPDMTRVTNRYNQWRHIPHNEQTYEERFTSWLKTPYDHDTESSVPKDEQIACSGIMALLPDNIANDDYGPWPDRIEDALRYLVEHLSMALRRATKNMKQSKTLPKTARRSRRRLQQLVRRRAYEFTKCVPYGALHQIVDKWTARKTAAEAKAYAAKLTHGKYVVTYRGV